MMPDYNNPWFRLGHAFERTLQTISPSAGSVPRLRGMRERGAPADPGATVPPLAGASPQREKQGDNPGHGGSAAQRLREAMDRLPILDRLHLEEEELERIMNALFTAGAGTLASRVLERWGNGRSLGVPSMLRAGAAGAGAALLTEALRPLLEKDADGVSLDAELAYALAEGVGRGLIYGLLLDRRIPGPPMLRGAVYGAAEYLVGPWGGLSQLLHPLTPQSSLPIVGALLDPGDTSGDTLAEHVVFGTTLGLLYGSGGD